MQKVLETINRSRDIQEEKKPVDYREENTFKKKEKISKKETSTRIYSMVTHSSEEHNVEDVPQPAG